MNQTIRKILKGRRFRESDSSNSRTTRDDLNRYGEERFRFNYPSNNYGDDFDPSYETEYDFNYKLEKSKSGLGSYSGRNFSGLGPKGYQRQSEQIVDEACEILAKDYYLDATNIEVGIDDRVLILKGEVSSRKDKKRAEALVENISGVFDVSNQLNITNSHADGWISDLGSIEDQV